MKHVALPALTATTFHRGAVIAAKMQHIDTERGVPPASTSCRVLTVRNFGDFPTLFEADNSGDAKW